jgi:N-formylglutamate amidohydrolase
VNAALSKENSVMQGLAAKKYGQARMRHEAKKLGLAPTTEVDAQPQLITARKTDVAEAAARLKAAVASANPE